ncbi:GNAT family N-acetyltransferase [soil metagenome]
MDRETGLGPPAPLDETHDTQRFQCGKPPLDDWIIQHAFRSEGKSARTYVVAKGGTVVVAYYCLAMGGVLRNEVPRKIRHGLPATVPVMILGRLAVDSLHQGKGLGAGLLKDAMMRTVAVSRSVGMRAMLIHAIDDEAMVFYTRYGFLRFPADSRTLFMPIETIIAAL